LACLREISEVWISPGVTPRDNILLGRALLASSHVQFVRQPTSRAKVSIFSHEAIIGRMTPGKNVLTMKVKMKNSLIQEFQHFLESKLIDVMKMEMQMIQFGSSASLLQI
jgi:hypothetical protein